MIPFEIARAIFVYTDVETSVAFSDVCSLFRNVTSSCDDSLVRYKVLRSVPWTQLDDEHKTWMHWARAIKARNASAYNGWVSAHDFNAVYPHCKTEHVYVEPENICGPLPQSFEPTFKNCMIPRVDGERYKAYTDGEEVLVEAELDETRFRWASFNAKTMQVQVHTRPREPLSGEHFFDDDVMPDVRDDIRILQETEKLIHFRYYVRNAFRDGIMTKDGRAEGDGMEVLQDAFIEDNNKELGNFLALPATIMCKAISYVHLLPDSPQCLVGVHRRTTPIDLVPLDEEEHTWLYLVDFSAQQVVLLTDLPSRPINWFTALQTMREEQGPPFESNHDYEVLTHNGKLHVYWRGLIIPLWLDLQRTEPITTNADHSDMFCSRRVKTWFNPEAPVITAIEGYLPPSSVKLTQAKGKSSRYVTIEATAGRFIGDLQTGTSYIAEDLPDPQTGPKSWLFATVKNNQVFYYRWCHSVGSEMVRYIRANLDEDSPGTMDMEEQLEKSFQKHPLEEWRFKEHVTTLDVRVAVYEFYWLRLIMHYGWRVQPEMIGVAYRYMRETSEASFSTS